MGKSNKGIHLEAMMGVRPTGVVCGLIGPDPGNLLDFVYYPGIVRIKSTTSPLGYTEYRIAGATISTTATVDTYVYVNGTTGAVATTEVTAGAAKPEVGGSIVPANSEYLCKVGNDGTNIDEVVDLRQMAGVDLVQFTVLAGFETVSIGSTDIPLNFTGRVVSVDGTVVTALAATSPGTVTPLLVTPADVATAITGGALSFAASGAIGLRDVECPSALNYFKAGDRIRSTSAKANVGGQAAVTYVCERL
ncbi:MAG TPA: hypothetical protein VMY40_08485 [Anaerolineae bacterium]|nr:hypothetical protein [Anaerolineae bacterium]